jgi:hypothetical protein
MRAALGVVCCRREGTEAGIQSLGPILGSRNIGTTAAGRAGIQLSELAFGPGGRGSEYAGSEFACASCA